MVYAINDIPIISYKYFASSVIADETNTISYSVVCVFRTFMMSKNPKTIHRRNNKTM